MKLSPHEKVAQAALSILARAPWESLTLKNAAHQANVPLGKAPSNKVELIPAIVSLLDKRVAESLPEPEADAPLEDILFERLMTRFDAMQPDRAGLIAVEAACRRTPVLALALHDALLASSLFPQPEGEKVRPFVKSGLFLAAYYFVFLRWREDETADMRYTMAALNATLKTCKNLGVLPP